MAVITKTTIIVAARMTIRMASPAVSLLADWPRTGTCKGESRMKLFAPDGNKKSLHHQKLYAIYELVFTFVEFAAGMMFLIGSWLFFYSELQTAATWLFVAGSACFVIAPALRLVRELHYVAIGDFADLARRAAE